MSCPKSHLVARYHDNELSAAERLEAEQHLEQCASCREELRWCRELSALLARVAPAEPSRAALQRWAGCLPVAQERGVLRLTHWMTALAAAVLVATTTWNAWSTSAGVATELELGPVVLSEPGETTPPTLEAARWMAMDLSAVTGGGVQR